MPPLTFTAKYTIISSTGDAFTLAGGAHRYLSVFTPAGSKLGSIVYAISQLTGFALNGGAYGPAPAGFSVIGSTMALNAPSTSCQVVPGTVGTALAEITETCFIFENSPVHAFRTEVLTGSAVPVPTFKDIYYTVNSLITQLVVAVHIIWPDLQPAANVFAQSFDELILSGEYVILAFSWTIDPPDGSNVEVDDIITITTSSPGADLRELDVILDYDGVDVPITEYITRTTTVSRFRIKTLVSTVLPNIVTVEGEYPTFFSGRVALGVLTVLETNASGIYMITPGLRHDTLYSSLRDGTTRDVRIPNPFAKTGYIGG